MSRTQVINIPTTCPIFNLCPAGTAPDSRAFFTPAVQTGSTNFLGSYRLVRSRHAEKVGPFSVIFSPEPSRYYTMNTENPPSYL